MSLNLNNRLPLPGVSRRLADIVEPKEAPLGRCTPGDAVPALWATLKVGEV